MRNTMKVIAAVAVLSMVFGLGCTATPVTIEISPPDLTINDASQSPTMTAKVLDIEEKPIEGCKIAWSSGDETVAKIDAATGKLTVVGSGRVEIKAETGATYGIAMVTVAIYKEVTTDAKSLKLWVGQVQKVDANIVDEMGTPISGEIVWESADTKIASVVGSRGEIRGVAPGTTTVSAKAKSLKTDVKVEVMKSGPADLQVSKALVKVKLGKTAKIEGIPLDEKGEKTAEYPVAYESYDTSVAEVAPDGTITTIAKGETKLGVTAGDKSVEVKIRVE